MGTDDKKNRAMELAIQIAMSRAKRTIENFVYEFNELNHFANEDVKVKRMQPIIDVAIENSKNVIKELSKKFIAIEKEHLFHQLLSTIYTLMENKNMSYEEVFMTLGLSEEFYSDYIQGLNRKYNTNIKNENEEELSHHIYKMNPPCPNCEEEHMWWHRRIPLWAEEKLEEYYRQNKDKSHLELLFEPAPVFVPQFFICSCCGKEFSYNMGIRIEDRLDWQSKGSLPLGVYPLFEK